MAKQGNLFGPIRLTRSKSVSNILFAAQVPGLTQPFEMPVLWDVRFTPQDRSNLHSVNPLIERGPIRPRQGTFRSSWYRFMQVFETVGYLDVAKSSRNTSYRHAWFEEGLALTRKFETFPVRQLIWVLDAHFSEKYLRQSLTLVLHYERGWNFNLTTPSRGEIRPLDLILVHCEMR